MVAQVMLEEEVIDAEEQTDDGEKERRGDAVHDPEERHHHRLRGDAMQRGVLWLGPILNHLGRWLLPRSCHVHEGLDGEPEMERRVDELQRTALRDAQHAKL